MLRSTFYTQPIKFATLYKAVDFILRPSDYLKFYWKYQRKKIFSFFFFWLLSVLWIFSWNNDFTVFYFTKLAHFFLKCMHLRCPQHFQFMLYDWIDSQNQIFLINSYFLNFSLKNCLKYALKSILGSF